MGKLVRDRIPEIIAAEGRASRTRVLGDEEYTAALLAKLAEETAELAAASSTTEVIGEAADVVEVLRAIAEHHGRTLADIVEAAERKRTARGGFGGRVWWESADPVGQVDAGRRP